jgi:glycine dehydrogenase subunit 1
MPFIPHTKEETAEMLREIGVRSIEELFDEIPQNLRNSELSPIPKKGLTEFEVKKLLENKLKGDNLGICFIGAGAYEHHIPAAVPALISRGEFLTAYTPYQAEASQGSLQLIYEYQTMIANLMGMGAANASVYDGASALTESILMAIRINKQKDKVVLLPRTIHPAYRYVAKSIASQQGIVIEEMDYDIATGKIEVESLKKYEDRVSVLVIPQPNFFGVLEAVDQLTNWAHHNRAIAIALVNPIAMSLLKEPGKWGTEGADIACGEGQPLGIPLASGGPYFGFMTCQQKFIRQMPGRIVGRTVDLAGKEGFTLTLQAREQHIRRAKATSNICTNQGLMVTAATIYMSLLGGGGLQQVAKASHAGALQLFRLLSELDAVDCVFKSPFFHEFVVRLNKPVGYVLELLALEGIQGGYNLSDAYPELGNALLICVTETKSKEEIYYYSQVLEKILMEVGSSSRVSALSAGAS